MRCVYKSNIFYHTCVIISRIFDPLRPMQVLGLLQLLGPAHVAPDAEETGVTHKQEVDNNREQQGHRHAQSSDPTNRNRLLQHQYWTEH